MNNLCNEKVIVLWLQAADTKIVWKLVNDYEINAKKLSRFIFIIAQNLKKQNAKYLIVSKILKKIIYPHRHKIHN